MLKDNMDLISQLISQLEKSSLSELSVETDEISISLKKPCVSAAPQEIRPAVSVVNENKTEVVTENKPEVKNGKEIKSPIVGTFYCAPSPDADSFVKIGDTVKKGDVVCIIEAMKMMNEITSEHDGVVIDILANDGDLVEYGQTIFVIQ